MTTITPTHPSFTENYVQARLEHITYSYRGKPATKRTQEEIKSELWRALHKMGYGEVFEPMVHVYTDCGHIEAWLVRRGVQ